MAKITNQSGLTANNLLLNTVELAQRTTISVNATAGTIGDTAGEFVTAGFAIGDRIIIRFANPTNPNNGYATIDAVTATSITVSDLTGTLTTQSAGQACSIQRLKKTIQFVEADGLDFIDGVSTTALASELQTLWDTGGYDVYPFPYDEGRPAAETLRFVEGWELHNQSTVNAIRDGAIEIYDGETGLLKQQYMNVTSPGFFNGTGRAYYWQQDPAINPSATITDFVTQGYVNQLVLIRDVPNSIDRRTFFTAKVAEPGRTVSIYDLTTEQSIAELDAKPYFLVLVDQLDLVLADASGVPRVSDATIAGSAPYTSITYSRFSPVVTRSIEGTNYNFNAIIERLGATKEQVHAKLNWLIRQKNTDIDSGSGTLLGGHSPAISSFTGSVVTYQGFADDTPANERNETVFIDAAGTERRFDIIAAFAFAFFLPAGFSGSATYKVYQESVFGTDDAPVMDDQNGDPITGTITGNTTVSWAIKYSTFNQNGHPPGTDIPIYLSLSGGANGIKPDVFGVFTVQNNTTQSFRIEPTATTAYRAAA